MGKLLTVLSLGVRLFAALAVAAVLTILAPASLASASFSQCPPSVPGSGANGVCDWSGANYTGSFGDITTNQGYATDTWYNIDNIDPNAYMNLQSFWNGRYGWALLTCSTPGTSNCGRYLIEGTSGMPNLADYPCTPCLELDGHNWSWAQGATQELMCAGTNDPICTSS